MKRYLCLFITLALLICSAAGAESLDLSAFTPEQLAALQQLINAELDAQAEPAGYDNTFDVLNAMADAGAPIKPDTLVDYTAETDLNGLLGTVGSYSSKTDFGCVGYASDYEGPVGGTIEYFPNEADAQTRYDYLQAIMAGTPMLADRVVYKCGNFVLRTDVTISIDVAAGVARALEDATGIQITDIFDPKGKISIDNLHGVAEPAATAAPVIEPAAPAAEAAPAESPVYNELKRGAKGTEAAKLQARLKALGFLNGLADGDFGPATEKAVKAFEAANGLAEDGVASVEDQAILFAAGVIKADGSIAKEYDPYEICPIELSNVDLKNSYGMYYASFRLKNISTQNVKAVSCTVRYFDAFGDRISDYGTSEQTVSIPDIAVGKSVSYSTRDDYSMFIQNAASASVAVTRVLMEDGTNIDYPDPVWFEGK